MSKAQPIGLLISPLLLRVVIGLTFTWAGEGKLFSNVPYSGQRAATLANLGVNIAPTTPGGQPAKPAEPSKKDAKPHPTGGTVIGDGPISVAKEPNAYERTDPQPVVQTGKQPIPAGVNTTTGSSYSASDFESPIELRRVYGLALIVYSAANPPVDAKNPLVLWPGVIGNGMWPVYIAHSVAIIELLGGVLLLAGLYSRFWALLLAGTMVGAVVFTQIGPAIWSGNATLFILPGHNWADVTAWMPLMWQLSLLAGCLSIMLLGSGALALDNSSPAASGGGGGKKAPKGGDEE